RPFVRTHLSGQGQDRDGSRMVKKPVTTLENACPGLYTGMREGRTIDAIDAPDNVQQGDCMMPDRPVSVFTPSRSDSLVPSRNYASDDFNDSRMPDLPGDLFDDDEDLYERRPRRAPQRERNDDEWEDTRPEPRE